MSTSDSSPPSVNQDTDSGTAGGLSHYDSGTIGGPGYGNKTGEFREGSVRGTVMEGVGKVLGKESVAEKGKQMKENS